MNRMGNRSIAMTLAAAVLAAGLVKVTSAQRRSTGPHVVQAERFEILDGSGTCRVKLGLLPENGGPYVELNDERGMTRLSLNVLEQGQAVVGLRDESGNLRISMAAREDGSPMLSLQDSTGEVRTALRAADDRPAYLSLSDERGRDRVGIRVTHKGLARLEFFDEDETITWYAPPIEKAPSPPKPEPEPVTPE